MSARQSTAWAAEPGITTTPLPRMQVRWRRGGWEAYCPCCAEAVAHARDRLYATRAAGEHVARRCLQRLAAHGLRPCRGCDGWGAVDIGGGHLDRCDSCDGACTQPLYW